LIEVRNRAVWVELSAAEVELLSSVPKWLGDVGTDPTDPAGPRLYQSAYPDDPIASAEFEVKYAADLEDARSADRSSFAETLPDAVAGVSLTEEQTAAWMRVIGDVRLVFAARMGIEDNTWERQDHPDPQMRLVHYLTYLQSGLIDALGVLFED
jgi:hypothetical protein